jgi:2-polyprenyl-3-methyl-5-hydroxy-6-metoxy-1,4-benzoquinol methylase
MDTDEWARRGSSFGAVASAYAEHRPDYPADAVRWCVAPTGRRGLAGLRVLDLGAGTGKLTAVLVAGGALGALWNSDDDQVGWVAGLRDVAKQAGSPGL